MGTPHTTRNQNTNTSRKHNKPIQTHPREQITMGFRAGNGLSLSCFLSFVFLFPSKKRLLANSLHCFHHFISLYILFFLRLLRIPSFLFFFFFFFLFFLHPSFLLTSLSRHLSCWLSPPPFFEPYLCTPPVGCTCLFSSHFDSWAMEHSGSFPGCFFKGFRVLCLAVSFSFDFILPPHLHLTATHLHEAAAVAAV